MVWDCPLDEALAAVERMHECHMNYKGDKPSSCPMSSLSNSMLYSYTVYTTIGYGDPVVKTVAGKVCTSFYALIGIPLYFAALTDACHCLYWMLTTAKQGIVNGWRRCRRKTRTHTVATGLGLDALALHNTMAAPCISAIDMKRGLSSNADAAAAVEQATANQNVRLSMTAPWDWPRFVAVTCILLTVLFCLPLPLYLIEGWHYFEAVYIYLQSVLLIGFGDETPTNRPMAINLLYILTFFVGSAVHAGWYYFVQERIRLLDMRLRLRWARLGREQRLKKLRAAIQKTGAAPLKLYRTMMSRERRKTA